MIFWMIIIVPLMKFPIRYTHTIPFTNIGRWRSIMYWCVREPSGSTQTETLKYRLFMDNKTRLFLAQYIKVGSIYSVLETESISMEDVRTVQTELKNGSIM